MHLQNICTNERSHMNTLRLVYPEQYICHYRSAHVTVVVSFSAKQVCGNKSLPGVGWSLILEKKQRRIPNSIINITKKYTYMLLFFHWFPLCRGEAGLLVTPMYGYFCDSFRLVPVVGIFSQLFFLLCLSQIDLSSHNPRLFSVVYHHSFGPCVQPISSGS